MFSNLKKILFLAFWGSLLLNWPQSLCQQAIANSQLSDTPLVENVWIDTPLTQIFRDISVQTGKTIALCPHVPDQLVSLDAGAGKPLDICLNELIAGRGLYVFQRSQGFYLITCGKSSCPSFLEIANNKRICLRYVSAKHLKACLPSPFQPYVSAGERPNEILVCAIPEIICQIENIIKEIDVARPQVVLEVLVTEVWETENEDFGTDWQFNQDNLFLSLTESSNAFTGVVNYTSIPKTKCTSVLANLRMLIEKEKAIIKSRPRVATIDGQEAEIDISLDEYFTIATDVDGTVLRTELQVIKSGMLLRMTPHVGDNNDITVDVTTEVSDVATRQSSVNASSGSNDLPVIRRRRVNTNVRINEGDAIVIGGLIESQENKTDRKIPFLSDIPVIGGLFGSKQSEIIEKEVVIFITPRIIRDNKTNFSDRHKFIDINEEVNLMKQKTNKYSMEAEILNLLDK
jgi:hypothetical protein